MKKLFLTSATLFTLLSPIVSAQSRYATTSANSGDALFGLGLMSTYLGFYAVCFCILFAIRIAIAVWVYRDAQKRTFDNPVLWLLVVIFGGIIGLVVYLIVRSDKPVVQNPNQPVVTK